MVKNYTPYIFAGIASLASAFSTGCQMSREKRDFLRMYESVVEGDTVSASRYFAHEGYVVREREFARTGAIELRILKDEKVIYTEFDPDGGGPLEGCSHPPGAELRHPINWVKEEYESRKKEQGKD